MGHDDNAQWIASLHFPSQAAKVLLHDRYWNVGCLRQYLRAAAEYCTREPSDGRHVSQVGLQLAQLLPACRRRHQLLIRALALHAWTHQACAAYAEALGLYRTAFQLTEHGDPEPAVAADLLRRYASFLRCRGQGGHDLEQARQAADRAVALLQDPPAESSSADWGLDLGRALTERALVGHLLQQDESVVADLGMALESLDPRRHEREVSSCLDLLAELADRSSTLDHLHRIARQIALYRDRIGEPVVGASSAASVRLAARVLSLDAELFRRMGALQRAERSLRRARRLLRKLPGTCDHDAAFLHVSLDLAELLAREERHSELLRLSSDTLSRVADGGFSLTRYRWRKALASGRLDLAELERIRLALGEEQRPTAASAQADRATKDEVVPERPTAVGE